MRSMTGYGRALREADGREMAVEVKTVNHRFLDLGFRMPRTLTFLEEPIRRVLAERFSRGHADVFVTYRNARADARVVSVDLPLARAYLRAYRDLEQATGLDNAVSLSAIAQMQDVLLVTECEEDREAVGELLKETLHAACDEVQRMREVEGEAMRLDLTARVERLKELRALILTRAPIVVEEYRTRLSARMEELYKTPLDPLRAAQEVALFADRAAIDEELVRLESHFSQLMLAFAADEPIGRKLDFLVQELNREINTIGSKSSDTQITGWVVEAKSEIEKLREQVQNIE